MRIRWETESYESETHGYTDGYEITISAPTTYRAGWRVANNTRTWTLDDEDGNTIATGAAEGLRKSKLDAQAALSAVTS